MTTQNSRQLAELQGSSCQKVADDSRHPTNNISKPSKQSEYHTPSSPRRSQSSLALTVPICLLPSQTYIKPLSSLETDSSFLNTKNTNSTHNIFVFQDIKLQTNTYCTPNTNNNKHRSRCAPPSSSLSPLPFSPSPLLPQPAPSPPLTPTLSFPLAPVPLSRDAGSSAQTIFNAKASATAALSTAA